jgi:hypothetical protein
MGPGHRHRPRRQTADEEERKGDEQVQPHHTQGRTQERDAALRHRSHGRDLSK